ncbi:MAG: Uncharacterised protein [Opitutia bacterium UBA7350]|nr:MAG: Uncharacterised protein [Opitutae bacterium UBA7350]
MKDIKDKAMTKAKPCLEFATGVLETGAENADIINSKQFHKRNPILLDSYCL